MTAGLVLTLSGEGVRLWAVHHIGVVSRTRSERLGPLVAGGPFALVRNPLYIGNILIWVGFALTARLVWMAPVVLALLAVEYHAIVRWEEQLLASRLGDAYRAYAAEVPRWIPRWPRAAGSARQERQAGDRPAFPPSDFLFSERGTLLAIAAGYLLLWTKARF